MNLKITLTALLLIVGISTQAQENKTQTEHPGPKLVQIEAQPEEGKIFRAVQQKAHPIVDLGEFFTKNIRYPKAAKKARIEGRVILEAIVEKDGSISNIRILKGQELGHGLPEEAIRVLKTTPKWHPAIAEGKAVRSYYIIPVTFNL